MSTCLRCAGPGETSAAHTEPQGCLTQRSIVYGGLSHTSNTLVLLCRNDTLASVLGPCIGHCGVVASQFCIDVIARVSAALGAAALGAAGEQNYERCSRIAEF